MCNKFFNKKNKNSTDESGKRSNHKGYTLIEVLIALGIFSIGILGVASMQILSTNHNSLSRMATEANTVGVDEMERLMILSYDDVDLDPASNPHTFPNGNNTVTWNVTDNLENKTINMTVTYLVPISGVTRRIALSCIKPPDF